MDKYEFNIKAEQMRKMADQGDYKTAMQIADTIDWRRVRNANLLSSVAEIYEFNKEYEEAKDILLLAFERAPVGKRFLFKLAEISVEAGDMQDALEFYREFCEMSPDDSRQYLLRYKILKEKGASAEQLLAPLEEYTADDVDEKWLYELAKLYSEAGYEDECVKTCDKIMLLFGRGQYVDKALELKSKYRTLSKQQMDLINKTDNYDEESDQLQEEYDDFDDEDNINSNTIYKKPEDAIINISYNLPKTEGNSTEAVSDDDREREAEITDSERLDEDASKDQESSANETEIKVDDLDINENSEDLSEVVLNNYHMIIEAKSKDDGFKIAVDEIKYFHDKYGLNFKVAKTNSEKLNEKGFAAFVPKIEGKDLIIEDAGSLTYKVVDEIAEYIDNLKDSSSVVLVDVVDRFDRMAEDRPLFIKRFDLVSDIEEEEIIEDVDLDNTAEDRISEPDETYGQDQEKEERPEIPYNEINKIKSISDIRYDESISDESVTDEKSEDGLPSDFYDEMEIDDFASYAQTYAKQIDCVLPGKTVLALYERIEMMQEDGIILNKASAEELIEDAADKAEKVGIGKKLTGVFHPKYDKEGRLILREDCFIN